MKTLAENDRQARLVIGDIEAFLETLLKEMRGMIGGRMLSKKARRDTYSAKEKAAYKLGYDTGYLKALRKFKAKE